MVGVDIFRYVESYGKYYNTLRFDVSDMEGRLQPGWILISFLCRQISSDFLLFKIIQAVFLNIAVFSFFKRETKYPFVCVFLYAISSYLLLNFNILRQSFALGFVLFAISYFRRKQHIRGVVMSFLAFMFHNSAFIVFVIPFFAHLKYNKKVFVFLSIAFILISVILIRIDYETLAFRMIESGILGDNISELGEHHLENKKFEPRDIQVGITRFIQVVFFLCILLYYIKKKKDLFIGGLGFVYLMLVIINYSIPIVFRFGLYFSMVFFIVFATTVIEYPMGRFRQIRQIVFLFSILIFSFFPFREYMTRYEGSKYRYIDQYYPYHSIFNPVYDPRKKLFFGV